MSPSRVARRAALMAHPGYACSRRDRPARAHAAHSSIPVAGHRLWYRGYRVGLLSRGRASTNRLTASRPGSGISWRRLADQAIRLSIYAAYSLVGDNAVKRRILGPPAEAGKCAIVSL